MLEDGIEPLYAKKPFSRRRHDLYLVRSRPHIAGELFLNQHDGHADDGIRILPLQEEEIPALVVQYHRLSRVDFMGVHHDIALSCLAEYPGQRHHLELSGSNDVLEDAPRSDRGELVHVSHKDEPRPRDHCLKEGMHQGQVHHGHLVDDDDVCFQRVLPVPEEPSRALPVLGIFRIDIDFQKPVYRLGLAARRLGHPLGGAPGGSCQMDAHALALKEPYHRVDGRRLPGPRSACEHKEPVLDGLDHRAVLHGVQLHLLLLFHLVEPALHQVFRHVAVDIQVMEHLRRIQLQIIIVGRIDARLAVLLFHHRLFLDAQVHDMFADILYLHPQKGGRPLHQDVLGEIHMPLRHCLLQDIKEPALYPVIGVRMYADARCNLVCRLKTHALDIVRKLVGIFLQHPVYTHAVVFVYLCRQPDGYPVFLEIDHRLAHLFLLADLEGDLPCLALADALDFRQPLRFLVDDAQRLFLKFSDDARRQGFPHAFDGAGAQIPLDGHQVFRLFHRVGRDFELGAVYAVVHVFSGQFQHLAFADEIKVADTGHFPVVIFQVKYRIAVFFIAEHDVLHISCHFLHSCFRPFLSFVCPPGLPSRQTVRPGLTFPDRRAVVPDFPPGRRTGMCPAAHIPADIKNLSCRS